MSRKLTVPIALIATGLIAAGCGGSTKTAATSSAAGAPGAPPIGATTTESSPTATVQITTGKPLPTTTWIVKSDAICAHYDKQISSLTITHTAELPRVLPREAAYVRAEVAQLAKLAPPTAKIADWRRLLDESERWAGLSTKLAGQASLGDAITRSPVAGEISAVRARLAAVAKHDGMNACAPS
jgi:hypothetical protein